MTKSLPINNGRQFISSLDILNVKKALQNKLLSSGPINKNFEKEIVRLKKSKYARPN